MKKQWVCREVIQLWACCLLSAPILTMDLAQRDQALDIMQTELQARQSLLRDQLLGIARNQKENQYLSEVKSRFLQKKAQMLAEKRSQCAMLSELSGYISNVSDDLELSSHVLQQAKIEQRKLIEEIERVQKEIQELE